MTKNDVENWTEVADQWIAWTRAQDQDAFWAYRHAFEAFVGPGTGHAVEIGAGEGRISRVLQDLGFSVTAVEPVPALLDAARQAGSATDYLSASATQLPLADNRFDLVMLYNVLMDVEDLQAASREAARVLRPEGRLICGLVHPIFDLVAAKASVPPQSYFKTHAFDATAEAEGLEMRFRGWQRPLNAYVNAFATVGLGITRMNEPQADPDHPASRRLVEWAHLPMFLWLELRPWTLLGQTP